MGLFKGLKPTDLDVYNEKFLIRLLSEELAHTNAAVEALSQELLHFQEQNPRKLPKPKKAEK